MLTQLFLLFIYFFTIFSSQLFFIYPKLFRYSDRLLYFTVFLNLVATIYLTYIETILSHLLALTSFVLLPSLYIYYRYGGGDHLLSVSLFSPYLLVLGIITWRPIVLTTLQTLALFISSIAYIILLTGTVLLAYGYVTINKTWIATNLLTIYAIFMSEGISSYVKYGVDGIFSTIYIPLGMTILLSLLIYSHLREYILLKYLSISLFLVKIITFLAIDFSGSNANLYFYQPYNTFITYYALVPIFLISRRFLKYVSLSGETSLMNKRQLSLLGIYGVNLFIWFRGIMAGLTPYRYIQLQLNYINDFINYVLPILLLLTLIYLLNNFTLALGLTILYTSINYLLSIHNLGLHPITGGLIIVFLIISFLKGFKDSNILYLAIVLTVVITGVYNVDYGWDNWSFYINLYTNENTIGVTGAEDYAILKDIVYNELTHLITAKFKIHFVLNNVPITLDELVINKHLYSIDVSTSELYLFREMNLIIIDILPDSSLMGSLDYFVSTYMLTNIDRETLLSSIFGTLICKVYVLRNALYFLFGNLIIFLIPILYMHITDRMRRHID